MGNFDGLVAFMKKYLPVLPIFAGILFVYDRMEFDVWFMLNGGRYVLTHGIPHVEPFTIHEGFDFVMQQWLTGVVFWKIYENFGMEGLFMLEKIVDAAILYLFYRLCMEISGNNRSISVYVTCLTGIFFSMGYIQTRPQIFSGAIFVAELLLLEKYTRTQKRRFLVPLPVMSVLLINLHAAMWPMMLVFMLPYFAASFRCGVLEKYFVTGTGVSRKMLLLAAAAIVLCGFINPYGLDAMTYGARSYGYEAINTVIDEMYPVSISKPFGKIFFAFVFLFVAGMARMRVPLQNALLSLGTIYMAMNAKRSVFLFYLACMPTICHMFRDFSFSVYNRDIRRQKFLLLAVFCGMIFVFACRFDDFAAGAAAMSLPLKIFFALAFLFVLVFVAKRKSDGRLFSFAAVKEKAVAVFLFVAFFAGAAMMNVADPKHNYGIHFQKAADYLSEHYDTDSIRLFNDLNSGGYMEFRGIPCYIDSRAEVFLKENNHKKDVFDEFFALFWGFADYDKFFDEYDFTHALVTDMELSIYNYLERNDDFELLLEYEINIDEHISTKCRLYRIKNK